MKLAVLVVLAALTAAQTVHFPGGEAVVTPANGAQHVVIKDAKGNVASDSYCDASSGSYDQIVRFGIAFKTAVTAGNRAQVARSMHYPLRVNAARKYTIANKAALLAHYADVFTPGVLAQLRSMEPHEVFCRNGMAMLANGTLWVGTDSEGIVRSAVVNR